MKFNTFISLNALIILGFSIAVVPVYLGLFYATNGLQNIAATDRTTNMHVFQQTKTLGLVLQKASEIERKARLFVLLSDPALRQPYERDSYESARTSFKQALAELLKLQIDRKIALLANELSEKENLIYEQIMHSESAENFKLPIDDAFMGFRETSGKLSKTHEANVEQTIENLRLNAEAFELDLMQKGFVLLLVSSVCVMILLTITSSSLRQLKQSIQGLTAGDLQIPIRIDGATDLHYMGERLNLLRTYLLAVITSKQQLLNSLVRAIEHPLSCLDSVCSSQQNSNLLPESTDGEPNGLTICVDALRKFYQQLMHYNQLQTGWVNEEKCYIDLEELIEIIIEQHREELKDKSIQINRFIKPLRIKGLFDPMMMLITQLLKNAIRDSPEQGEIRISVRKIGNRMELDIEDDGPGIASELREDVFAPFYRDKTDACGSHQGMGLAMVKECVILHQGTVEVLPPSPNHHGARVRVQIPLDIEA